MSENPGKPKLVVKLIQDKKTTGTQRYKELVDNPGDPVYLYTLYLKNAGVAALGNPGSLVVTIEAGD